MAFVPINGRPFTTWFTAFVKAIYSPTEYFWVPEDIAHPPIPVVASMVIPITPPAVSIPAPAVVPPVPKPVTAAPAPVLPSFSDFLAAKPNPNQTAPAFKETTVTKFAPPPTKPIPPAPAGTSIPLKPGLSVPVSLPSTTDKPEFSPPPVATASVPARSTFSSSPIPQAAPISSAPPAAATSMISPPSQPNILSGLVIDSQNQPMSQITIEIIDTKTGIPARALRTNKLGQFQIAIPLPAGTYNINAEREGLEFDSVSIQVKGSIIPPVVIQSRLL